ncbi:DUF4157 domain-containing protein [Streptomyces sp. E-08]|uniref:eCIS core domain-containing protein n=1 Tax=Streptomyces sp. E-08 TaxID=3404047 RepID=UPI003CF7E538
MLRRAGQAPALQEQHQHGAGCGHPQAVQRSAVHDVLRTGGRPLDDRTRTDMEARLGADFSDVRIHDDAAAQASAAEVGARAYTSGHHVVVGAGGGDAHTLAHELTHVIQQRRGPVAGTENGQGLKVSDPSDRHEREAEANAVRVMRSAAPVQGAPATESAGPVAASSTGTTPAIQRHISFNPTGAGGNPQFEVDGTRPGWQGPVAGAPGAGNSRNHQIPFDGIQNDLALRLNNYMNFGGVNGGAVAQAQLTAIEALTDSLFPTAGTYQRNMRATRAALIRAIDTGNANDSHNYARSLLSQMNSSPDNIRNGPSGLNSSISDNLDVEFNAGSTPFTGSAETANGVQQFNALQVLTLQARSNDIVFGYSQGAVGAPGFVLDPVTGLQMSSTAAPSGVGRHPGGGSWPVLVRDPSGAGNHLLFWD